MSAVQDYARKFAKDAIAAEQKYGIDTSVILAQGSLESNSGQAYGPLVRHNHFGITAYGKPNEYWDGSYSVSSSSGLKFRIYKTDRDSFLDFARLISTGYPSCAKVSGVSDQYAKCIANSPYISEKNGDNRSAYESTVAKRAKEIKPIVEEFKKKASPKNLYFFIIVSVILLLVITGTVIWAKKQNKK